MVRPRRLLPAMAVLAGFAALLCAPGCRSPREIMQETRRPRNRVFNAAEMLPKIRLEAGKEASFLEWERTDTQSFHVLQLAPDAVLDERFHENHDLSLMCISGSAIVEVEGERHFVEPPTVVVIPRLRAYRILPHRTEKEFVALMVFCPPFGGEDWVLRGD